MRRNHKPDHPLLAPKETWIPSPTGLAFFLTGVIMVAGWWHLVSKGVPLFYASGQVVLFWQNGFWDLLGFAMQMVLILVLGHALALSPIVNTLLTKLAKPCHNSSSAAAMAAGLSIFAGFINWGLCLIVGAVFARKVAESAHTSQSPINYPLVGAAGYTGMMVWHGGFSGSAPLSVADSGHILMDKIGTISIQNTILSSQNISASLILFLLIPTLFFVLGKVFPGSLTPIEIIQNKEKGLPSVHEKKWPGKLMGLLILSSTLVGLFAQESGSVLGFINLNTINFILLGCGLLLHPGLSHYLKAIEIAGKGAMGIIVQFPFYAGIMGIIQNTGLLSELSGFFISNATQASLPVLGFISAAIINIFIPSGGGQWAIQGPLLCESALQLNVPTSKIIMAFAYGDQLTNMIQPFWALPLLGITGLKAKHILPYSFAAMIMGSIIFLIILLL
jgi:short-chain fatty acids transporter